MDYSTDEVEPVHPGTPSFFPALLEHIKSAAPGLPTDPVILQSLLLCIMAGNKHVILRTREEDVSVVQNLTALLLTNALCYRTHKHKLRRSSRPSPSSFLSSFFFAPTHPSLSATARQSLRSKNKRSRSYPVPSGEQSLTGITDSELETLSSNHLSSFDSKSRPSLRPLGVKSNPAVPLAEVEVLERARLPADAEMPQAVVVSGLEHASVPCQRALLRTFIEGRIALDEDDGPETFAKDLPPDFFVVYVCPWNPRERPKIHKSLLDQFSMSATIGLHPNTRHAYASYLASTLPTTIAPSLTPPASPDAAPLPSRLLSGLRELSTAGHTYTHASLRLYIADLFAAARHHHELDGTLLGARAARDAEAIVRAHRVLCGGDTGIALIERAATLEEEAEKQAEKQAKLGRAEINRSAIASTHGYHDHDRLDEFSIATPRGGEEDINDGLDIRVHLHWRDDDDMVSRSTDPSASPMLPMEFGRGLQDSSASLPIADDWWAIADKAVRWDVSEVDVAKVVPRVISHRLRVRAGPEHEILSSVMFPAAIPGPKLRLEDEGDKAAKEIWRRRTVKEIMVKIMKEV